MNYERKQKNLLPSAQCCLLHNVQPVRSNVTARQLKQCHFLTCTQNMPDSNLHSDIAYTDFPQSSSKFWDIKYRLAATASIQIQSNLILTHIFVWVIFTRLSVTIPSYPFKINFNIVRRWVDNNKMDLREIG
jgi:hypothetical protein